MAITIADIQQAVVDQPELKNGLISSFKEDFTKSLETEGAIIRTKEQDAEYIRNYEEKVIPSKVDAKVSEKFKNHWDEIDKVVTDLTGAKREEREKTTDFIKRSIKELGSKGGDSVTKEKVAQLERMLEEKENTWSAKYNEAVTKAERRELEENASAALNDKNFPYPAHVKTDEEKTKYAEVQKRMLRTDFMNNYTPKRDADGNIVYYDGDKALLNSKDGKPLTAKQIIEDRYSFYFMPTGREVKGTGQGQGDQVVTPGNFKNKDDIHKYLAQKGLVAGEREYMTELQSLAKEAKIDI